MNNIELLKQLRIVFVGIPDAGKSTLISNIIKFLYNKIISPDTLMNELEYSNGKDIYGNADTRTIKAAKILMPYKNYEFMLIDAPGHIEYKDQITNAIRMSSIVVFVCDKLREEESYKYFDLHIKPEITKDHIVIKIFSHSEYNDFENFNPNIAGYHKGINFLLSNIEYSINTLGKKCLIDVEKEANEIIESTLTSFKKCALMFSGGKDSIVGNHIISKHVTNIDKIFPHSGYDFDSLESFIKNEYPELIWKDNLLNTNYNDNTVFEIHKDKAKFNVELEKQYDCICINYRCSDEGVRSKDHYIKDGIYCKRFSPVFYFSEENIWRYIRKYDLKIPPLYYRGYRSLGDEPVTIPCMPLIDNIDGIIEYVHKHPFEERDGRTSQDNSEKYAMEKLRNVGFF